ncbi:MAG: DUF86 domain-containing protein [Patescibacteria group bacterium]
MDKFLLNNKVESLKEYLEKLKLLCAFTTNEILADFYKFHTAERLFQLVVDISIDINIHIIKEKITKLPNDFQSTFTTLGESGIFDQGLMQKMAPVVGLRNRIVHRYDTIDRVTFIELLKKNLSDFDQYLAIVSSLIKKL